MKITAAILAGGRSSRMGRSKALLEIEGDRLIDRTRVVLESLHPTVSRVVISGDPTLFPKAIPDVRPFRGPVEGIKSVAKALLSTDPTHGGLLVVPVDLPLLSPEALRPLIDHFLRSGGQAAAYSDTPLPAIFRLDGGLIDAAEGTDSVHGLLDALKAHFLAPPELRALTNTNTPEEWAQIVGRQP